MIGLHLQKIGVLLGLVFWVQAAVAQPKSILTDASLEDEARVALTTAADQVSAWLAIRTGRTAPSNYLLLGAGPDSVSQVLDAAYEKLEKPRPQVNADFEVLCGGPHPNAISSSDFILMCFPETDARQINTLRLGAVMAHEMFHQMQYDLSDTRRDRPGIGPRRLGPAWLVEGSAEVIEFLYINALLPADGPGLFELQTPARRSRKKLSSLQAHGSVRDPVSYGVSRFAATLLAREYGVDGFVNYFSALGEGQTRPEAFVSTFGLSHAVFDAEFDKLRRDCGAARDWSVGQ